MWGAEARKTRVTLAEITDWDRVVSRRVTEHGKIVVTSASKADVATQLICHEVHHRAQAVVMLRLRGVEAPQNLDYILLAQRREEFPGALRP